MDHDQSAQGSLNISDVIEVIRTTDPVYDDVASNINSNPSPLGETSACNMEESIKRVASVQIVEQPASKALRFRYECEGRSAGSIPGVNSTPENKTFPSIQIIGYKGPAVVVVSCVTKDPPYRPHPHNLVGKEGCKQGVCTMKIDNENMAVTFSNLGIQCVKKKDIEDALKLREQIRVDPFRTGYTHRNQPTSIDLNAVRLCFQVFLEGSVGGKFTVQLTPVVSDPIYDKKAMSDLVICKLSHCSCSVIGGKEIILLCEKVAKEDIQVRFYEEQAGHIVWESNGEFQPTQVHKQVAITFRSPRYKTLEVEEPVKVNIQLRRPSDGVTSEPLAFEFQPLDSGRPAFWSLRKALAKKGNYTVFSSILASNTALLTGSPSTGGAGDEQARRPAPPVVEVESMEEGGEEGRREESGVVDDQQYSESNEWGKLERGDDDANKVETTKHRVKAEGNLNEEVTSDGETCRSLNELLSQVAELDEIYSDTKARLLGPPERPSEDLEMEVDDTYHDDDPTYSSLQMAMKNPVELNLGTGRYEESPLVSVSNNKRDVPDNSDSKLPPLPPKRIKKNPPAVPSRPSQPAAPGETVPGAPTKTLPPTPDPTPKTSKPSIFQKLFSKKPPKSGSKKDLSGSLRGSVGDISTADTARKGSLGNVSSSKQPGESCGEFRRDSLDDVSLSKAGDGELTEAEHFALYTDMAPHATVSEFDEMSFYYSPVEGGKIVTPDPTNLKNNLNNEDVFT